MTISNTSSVTGTDRNNLCQMSMDEVITEEKKLKLKENTHGVLVS